MKRPKFTAGYKAVYLLVEKLLEVMEIRDVSKAELARRVGVKRPSVTKWFTPGRNLTLFTAATIADALGAEIRFALVDRETRQVLGEPDPVLRLTPTASTTWTLAAAEGGPYSRGSRIDSGSGKVGQSKK